MPVLRVHSITTFQPLLLLHQVILHLHVDWSGEALAVRKMLDDVLDRLPAGAAVYSLNCSGPAAQTIEDWLHALKLNNPAFSWGGWGELVFLVNGKVQDVIPRPAQTGSAAVAGIIGSWLQKN